MFGEETYRKMRGKSVKYQRRIMLETVEPRPPEGIDDSLEEEVERLKKLATTLVSTWSSVNIWYGSNKPCLSLGGQGQG